MDGRSLLADGTRRRISDSKPPTSPPASRVRSAPRYHPVLPPPLLSGPSPSRLLQPLAAFTAGASSGIGAIMIAVLAQDYCKGRVPHAGIR